ncbi:hypothetical protein [Pelosinus sp. sgz500959]|uniref:hypothetical protein n=1 Tax=Pelosinus sp. sgz500959 TaxID=3242472 RepID=UPI00366BBC2E
MRLRRHYKNYKRSEIENNESQINEEIVEDKVQETKKMENSHTTGKANNVKEGKSLRPLKMIRQLMKNPNFNMQLMVILLSLTSDNMQMDRRIDGMTTTIDKLRTITELVNNGMSSMKVVSEVPKNIRRILE